jgi:hypothetical protein
MMGLSIRRMEWQMLRRRGSGVLGEASRKMDGMDGTSCRCV